MLGVAGAISLWAYLDARLKRDMPRIQYPTTQPDGDGPDASWHQRVISRCSSLLTTYDPVPFLTNRHVETIYAAKMRKSPVVNYIRECLLMPDGGCVTLDWEHQTLPDVAFPADAPVLILLPGLTGGSHDSYVMHAVKRAAAQGMRAVVFNSRGTSDSPVTVPQYYSASFTDDMRAVVAHVHKRYPDAPLLAAGWSLGANILVRYLGEEGADTPVCAAVSLCNPFDLTISNHNLTIGFNQVYDKNLANSLRSIHAKHEKLWAGVKGKFNLELAATCKTIREFDDAITIHSFGWPSVDDYYANSSSARSIPHVAIPLLCVQALDDPIAPAEAIPYQALAQNPNTVLVTTPCGGHLGWVSGSAGPRQHPWSDQPMMEWLGSVLNEFKSRGDSPGPKPVEPVAVVLGRQRVNVVAAASTQPATPSPSTPTPAGEAMGNSGSAAWSVQDCAQGTLLGPGVGDAPATIVATAAVRSPSNDLYALWKAKQQEQQQAQCGSTTAATTTIAANSASAAVGGVPSRSAFSAVGTAGLLPDSPTRSTAVVPTAASEVLRAINPLTPPPTAPLATSSVAHAQPQEQEATVADAASELGSPSFRNLIDNLMLAASGSPVRRTFSSPSGPGALA